MDRPRGFYCGRECLPMMWAFIGFVIVGYLVRFCVDGKKLCIRCYAKAIEKLLMQLEFSSKDGDFTVFNFEHEDVSFRNLMMPSRTTTAVADYSPSSATLVLNQ